MGGGRYNAPVIRGRPERSSQEHSSVAVVAPGDGVDEPVVVPGPLRRHRPRLPPRRPPGPPEPCLEQRLRHRHPARQSQHLHRASARALGPVVFDHDCPLRRGVPPSVRTVTVKVLRRSRHSPSVTGGSSGRATGPPRRPAPFISPGGFGALGDRRGVLAEVVLGVIAGVAAAVVAAPVAVAVGEGCLAAAPVCAAEIAEIATGGASGGSAVAGLGRFRQRSSVRRTPS